MDVAGIVVLVIFVAALLAIMSERVNDTATALLALALSAAVLYLMNGIPFIGILATIDWDVILFVTAMMVIVSVVASLGLFQFAAIIIARRTGGQPRLTFIYLMLMVFVISLFFDPLPAMIIVSTVTVEVCNAIDVDFRPYLMCEVVVAGLASLPTPIGSVTNLVIVYMADINIGLMLVTLFPLSVLLFIVTLWYMMRKYSDSLAESEERELTDLFLVDPRIMMRSNRDFYTAMLALGGLVVGIVFAPEQASIVALLVATILLLLSGNRAKELLRHLSWDTVFFLVGMIGVVQAMVLTGVIEAITLGFQGIIGNNVLMAVFLMIMVPGGVMSPMDAKAVGVLLAPVAGDLSLTNPMIPISLSVGTNLGSYVVPFGDAPCIVVVSLAEKKLKPISWAEFNRAIIPLGVLHLIVATIYCALVSLFFI
ncbi:MAG: SLC13 family permease [Candidatus Thorarchaeota archaeon]